MLSVEINCQQPYEQCIRRLSELVTAETFVEDVKLDEYSYRFHYKIKADQITEVDYCIDGLKAEVGNIGPLLPEVAPLLNSIVGNIARLDLALGGRIYPSSLIWKDSQQPAGLDLSYALALYSEQYLLSMGDFLLATDPNHSVHEVPCLDSLVRKYGLRPEIVYLLASYCLHGTRGFDYLISLVEESDYSTDIKDPGAVAMLTARMEEINAMAGGRYEEEKGEILEIIGN